MYINAAHYYFPKIFGTLSFVINPLFVYLLFSDKKSPIGNYRYLLLYFACFNVFYSIADISIPLATWGYGYAFNLFIVDGYFQDLTPFNQSMLSARGAMISCSYAILLVHFAFRYMVVIGVEMVGSKFKRFMIFSIILTILYFLPWYFVAEYLTLGTLETKKYIREEFYKEFHEDSLKFNFITSIYNEVDESQILKGWIGIFTMTTMATFSTTMYIVLGTKIMKKLNEMNTGMSEKSRNMQRDLFRALVIQTVIPICVSYAPCSVAWFLPIFKLHMGYIFDSVGVIAISTFPFFDPVAIILCLPILRNRFWKKEEVAIIPAAMTVTEN